MDITKKTLLERNNKYVLHVVIVYLLLFMLCGSANISRHDCVTFRDFFFNGSSQNHRCNEGCLNIFNEEKIYGTKFYSPDSLICRSALHAGVLGPEGGDVDIRQDNVNGNFEFVGTIRHRVVSYSQNLTSSHYYSFSNPQWTPKDLSIDAWMADVTMVHNSYKRKFSKKGVALWVTCLYEESKYYPEFYSWSFKKINLNDKNGIFNNGSRSEIIWLKDDNARIVRCLGKNHFMDVQGFMSKPTDDFLTSKLTYRGVRDESLEIKFKKFKENVSQVTERLPDSTSTTPHFSKLIVLTNLTDAQSDYFIVREADTVYDINVAKQKAAHFQVYIQDCPYDSYGIKCKEKCHCKNDGICHPTIGACICRPGFYGAKCNDSCELGAFGSKCQFRCTSSFLGQGVDSRNTSSCIGLIFCLPEPLGCSCAFGYKGRFCDIYENLPFMKKPFNLFYKEGKVTIKFEEWDRSRDGGLEYGLVLDRYVAKMNNLTGNLREEASGVFIGEAIFDNIEDNVTFDVRIGMDFRDPYSSKDKINLIANENVSKIRRIQFSSPCLRKYERSFNQTITWIEVSFPIPSVRAVPLTCHLKIIGHPIQIRKENPIGQLVHYKIDGLKSGQQYRFETWCENKFGNCERESFLAETLIDAQKVTSFQNCTLTVMKNHFPNQTEFNLTVVKIIDEEKWKSFVSSINEFGIIANYGTSKSSIESLIEQSSIKRSEGLLQDKDYSKELEDCTPSEPYLIGIILNYKLRDLDIISATSFSSGSGSIFGITATYVIATLVILILLFAIILILKRRRDGKSSIPSFDIFGNGMRRLSKTNHELVSEPPRNSLRQQHKPVRPFNPQVASNMVIPNTRGIQDPQRPPYMNAGSKEIKYPGNEEGGYMNVKETNVHDIAALPEMEKKLNEMIYSSVALQQFQSIPFDCGKPMEIGKNPINIMKNRYKNNLPYDENRVVLSTIENDPHSDYINASFVKGLHPNNWYIACQGPKDKNKPTIGDFWRMVIEMDVDIIVMIANFSEDKKVKVGRYFKKDEPLMINDMVLTVIESIEFSHFWRSEIQVSSTNGTKCIVHYQFIKWPDHGVPTQVYPICSMLKAVLAEVLQGTMVVHCSAGIGRTGSVLFVILLKELLEQYSLIDPTYVLKHVRESRARLIENIQQYNFSLEVLHYLLLSEKGLIVTTRFEGNFEQLKDEGCYLYDELVAQPINLTFDIGQTSSIIALNRNRAVLPADLHVVSGTSVLDYINAIYVDLEDVRKALIVTEHPMSSTVYRFWQMVVKKGCSSLILINDNKASENYPSLYSIGECTAVQEDFFIDVQQAETEIYEGISCYSVTISIAGASHFLEVYQVQNWSRNEEIPSDITVLESISNIVLRTAQTKTPAVLCCSDGVTGCGLVASALNVISHLQLYQEINIYYVALKMRRYRPQFITSQRQFLALYEAAFSFLQNNSHYQNFQ